MAASAIESHVDDLAFDLEILVGTYEEFVLGFKLSHNSEGGPSLTQSFTNHSHCASIRAVATSKKFLASGSADESIRLFSLKNRTEHGYLQQHTGTINCLKFYKDSHLLSGSDDGNVCVWNTRTWNCDKTLVAHKGGVTALSIHPSGKLALTVGRDRAMKTWNLIKGRTAYVTNIKAIADDVQWAPDGNHYAVATNNIVSVYQVKSAGICYSVDMKCRVHFITFNNRGELVVGGECPYVEVHSISENKLIWRFKAHEKRVRAGGCVGESAGESQADCSTNSASFLVTASNDGLIKLWRFNADCEPSLVTQVDSTCRITCMSLWYKKRTEADAKPALGVVACVAESPSRKRQKSNATAGGSSDDAVVEEEGPLPPPMAVAPVTAGIEKPLKPAIKRKKSSEAKVIDTPSGKFIVEDLKKRDEHRARLSFKIDAK